MAEGAKEDKKKKGCFKKVKTWFAQLSFWKKIIIIFTLNTLILLILTDAIMLALFDKISQDITLTSHTEQEKFNFLSNGQILEATSRNVLSQVDFYADILAQLTSAFGYFEQNRDLYTSLEGTSPQNPKYSSDFTNVSYN